MENLLSITGFLSQFGSILVAVLVLLITITIHEFGHYIVGKLLKFKINEFAIGMGPAIFKKTLKNGQIFSIRILPLGGFCAFAGEDEEVPKTQEEAVEKAVDNYDPNAFNNKKPWQRILVLIAGASVNFIFAVILIVSNFAIFGHTAYSVYETMPTAGYSYSLQQGDTITAVDGNYVYLSVDLIKSLSGKKQGDIVDVSIVRNGEKMTVPVELRCDVNPSGLTDYGDVFESLGVASVPFIRTSETSLLPNEQYLLRFNDGATYQECSRIYKKENLVEYFADKKAGDVIGVWVSTDDETAENGRMLMEIVLNESFDSIDKSDYKAIFEYFGIEQMGYSYQLENTTVKLSFGELIYRPIVYSFKTIGLTFESIGGMFKGTVPLDSVTGPIGTISLTADYVGLGLNYLLEIASLIGISVAIFNLLPIPALDGARTIFTVIEWIRGKPINRKVEAIIHAVGLFLLLGIAIFFDILHIF